MIDKKQITEKYNRLTGILIEKNLTISTMESCTGGLIGVLLSDLSGASSVVRGGFFTYTNEMKTFCGVDAAVINEFGVYSVETARAMAAAVREKCGTDIGIGVTGSIGTVDPANPDSVPGEVYAAVDRNGRIFDKKILLPATPASRMESRWYIADQVAELVEK